VEEAFEAVELAIQVAQMKGQMVRKGTGRVVRETEWLRGLIDGGVGQGGREEEEEDGG
jgi:hypothetical protein